MFQDQAGELTDEIRELLASYNSVVSFYNDIQSYNLTLIYSQIPLVRSPWDHSFYF